MMEETKQRGGKLRPQPNRSSTLSEIYTGNRQKGQDPNERLEYRKESIREYYSISKSTAGAAGSVVLQQINRFADTNRVLLNALDEIARIHPFISVAVLAFKAVASIELARRDNDKRILLLFVKMQDMMGTILEFDKLSDPDGSGMRSLENLIEKLKKDIEDCGSVCDSYRKKHVVSRILKSKLWEPKLEGYIALFEADRQNILDFLAMYTAQGVSIMNEKIGDFQATVTTELKEIKALFEQLRSPKEKQLLEAVKREGGEDKFRDNKELRKLLLISEGKPTTNNDTESAKEAEALSSIRGELDEMKEDLIQILAENREVFDRKMKAQTQTIIAETKSVIMRVGEGVISALARGPYDRIIDPTLHKVWKDMQFRGSVKARQLILALREYYWEQLHPSTAELISRKDNVPASRSASPVRAEEDEEAISMSDEWTLGYINIVRIQPLVEAFDDDASGFITVREANQFTNMRPPDWSVPRWIAYWAAGFPISVRMYCDKIKLLLNRMQNIAESSLPANRVPISSYLASHSLSTLERVLAGISQGQMELRWSDFSDSNLMQVIGARDAYEEERIESKLKELKWYIDDSSTVTLITGPGRIEMYLMTLLHMLVKRHCLIVEFAQSVVVSQKELKEAEESIESIWTVVQDRLDGLKAVFRQQNLDPNEELRRFCYGVFSYFEESDEIFAAMHFNYFATRDHVRVWFYRSPVTTEGRNATEDLVYGVEECESGKQGDSASTVRDLWRVEEEPELESPLEGTSEIIVEEPSSAGVTTEPEIESGNLVYEEAVLPTEDVLHQSLADSPSRMLTFFNHTCDNCSCTIKITRYMCLVCTAPAKLLSRQTVDFCSDCVNERFPPTVNTGPSPWIHLPGHDVLQTRTELHSLKYILASGKVDEAKKSLSNLAAGEHRCSPCGASVTSPVWACVTCEKLTLVCVECNEKEQQSKFWALPSIEKDSEESTHNWSHPLVLCQPANATTQGESSSRLETADLRIVTMEKHLAHMTERMGNVERLLSQLLQNVPGATA